MAQTPGLQPGPSDFCRSDPCTPYSALDTPYSVGLPSVLRTPYSAALPSRHPADDALEVARLAAGDRDRVVRGRAAALEDLQVPPRLHRHLRDQVFQVLQGNQPGAAARHEHPVAVE